MALLNCTRKPRLTCTCPLSSIQGTRKMICRSGSTIRSKILRLGELGVLVDDRGDRLGHFPHGLVELHLSGVPRHDHFHDAVDELLGHA